MNPLEIPLIREKIALLPDRPGSYQMKDKDGTIIYVGKAKSLLKRVKQYFTRPQSGKVFRMVCEIRDFDIIETQTEKEALLLEISLIHQYYPKYNIMLMDDKMYPYIALRKGSDPFLKISRSDKEKGYLFFGPYPNSSMAYKTIDLLNKIYPLRKCRTLPKRPCLYYHLGQCLAPCVRKVPKEDYDRMVHDIALFLKGETRDVVSRLESEMKERARNLEFERAKELHDLLLAIENTTTKQKVMFEDHVDRDVVGYSVREGYLCVVFLLYRKGVLLGKNVYVEELEDDIDDVLESLVVQFYQNHPRPKELIVPHESLCSVLTSALGFPCSFPTRGKRKDLLAMALENSRQMLDEHFQTARLKDDVLVLLEELQKKLGLSRTPLDIELYDNSHTQGAECVGAMVKFINGEKAPSLYRKYRIRQENSQDDLASMREVLSRRFARLVSDRQKLPDLIVVDGGENQCQVALECKAEAGVDIPICGLKKNERHETDSLLNADTGEIIPLDRKSPLFFLLMRMQDEVHRYAISYHRSLRGKSAYRTLYDDIPGIGRKRKETLLSLYPTVDALEGVTEKELCQVVPSSVAEAILKRRDEFFQSRKGDRE